MFILPVKFYIKISSIICILTSNPYYDNSLMLSKEVQPSKCISLLDIKTKQSCMQWHILVLVLSSICTNTS